MKFTFKLIRSLLVLLGRVLLILCGLVFFSSVNAFFAFLSSGSSDVESDDYNHLGEAVVVDEVTASNALANGTISEMKFAQYIDAD